jgi:nuclear pore complex protein Nup107
MFTKQDRRRERELDRIRRIYIPELILRLHNVLLDSRHRIPEYVCYLQFKKPHAHTGGGYRSMRHVLDLVNIVADARYGLHEVFGATEEGGGRPLGTYLDAVRRAMLTRVEFGGSDPFRDVKS